MISGTIEDIGKDILGAPYLTLQSGATDSLGAVQAVFPTEASGQLAMLKKGAFVSVVCTVDGLLMNVIVRNCRL